MSWRGSNGIPYTTLYVKRNAPSQSGVYVLYGPAAPVVFVGESADIQARLLEHLDRDDDGIAQHAPSLFAYELVPLQSERLARVRALTLELHPLCRGPRSPLPRREAQPAQESPSGSPIASPARPPHAAPAS